MLAAALILFTVLDEPHRFSALDLWERECREGDQDACKRHEQALAGAGKLDRLSGLALRYGANADRSQLEQDGRPLLYKAYKEVMADFIDAELAAGNTELAYDEEAVEYCSDHFHNYWVNRKLWWPTDDNGDPSWTDIYYYIVDHYHGVCLRRHFNKP